MCVLCACLICLGSTLLEGGFLAPKIGAQVCLGALAGTMVPTVRKGSFLASVSLHHTLLWITCSFRLMLSVW